MYLHYKSFAITEKIVSRAHTHTHAHTHAHVHIHTQQNRENVRILVRVAFVCFLKNLKKKKPKWAIKNEWQFTTTTTMAAATTTMATFTCHINAF